MCWCGSMAEQLICNQQVDGSTPFTSSIYGGFPEWPKGADCKSVVTDFGGPNPPSPTNKNRTFVYRQMFCFCLSKPQAWHIITARSVVYIIKGGKPPLYLITRQRASCLRLDDIQHFVLMICNSYGIDDIQGFALIYLRKYDIINHGKTPNIVKTR